MIIVFFYCAFFIKGTSISTDFILITSQDNVYLFNVYVASVESLTFCMDGFECMGITNHRYKILLQKSYIKKLHQNELPTTMFTNKLVSSEMKFLAQRRSEA